MPFLYFLESIRNPVLDAFFAVVTVVGEETFFMAAAIIVFWCIDKYEGYYIFSLGFFGTLINQFLKIIFRVPRPWVKDPNFTIVESARAEATGYSFPSGHTQNAVVTCGGIARWSTNRILRIVCIVLCLLVPLSRLYLGVHTPLDVLVSLAISIGLIFLLYPLMKKAMQSPAVMYGILLTFAALSIAFALFVCLYSFPTEVYLSENIGKLLSAQKQAFTMLGCAVGFLLVYTADLKWLKFKTEAVWWVQLIKIVGGLAIVLAAKELLRFPLEAILDANTWARMIRYASIFILGGIVWPMTFPFLSKLGKK